MPAKLALFLLCSVFISAKATADDSNLYIGTAVAGAFIHKSGYKNDTSLFFPNLGYQSGQLFVEAGLANIGSFKLQQSADTRIDVDGLSIFAGKQFNLDNGLAVNIHGGAILWKSEAILLGNVVGEDEDTSAILGFGFSKYFIKSRISIRTQLQRLSDISGTDISLLSAGINFYL